MLKIGSLSIASRLFLGTAQYPSPQSLKESIEVSGSELVTVSLRREGAMADANNGFWDIIRNLPVNVLPNTAGCFSVKEAITTAKMAREVFQTNRIKLEVIGNDYTLQPDPFGLVEAAKELAADGFEVFPYMTEDLVLAEKLLDAGCVCLMPWASPIGSGQGVANPKALVTLRQAFPDVPMVVDAGIGKPSHAAQVMEMGFDAVLLNTAVSNAHNPPQMATAFKYAIEAGLMAKNSGMMPERDFAKPSTPTIGKPFAV